MKLFLTSMAISYSQGKPFADLVGISDPKDIKIALIENAADVYEEGKKDWVYQNRDSIKLHGFNVNLVDLNNYLKNAKGFLRQLENADAIWLGGGNTYYLRWILKETKADLLIKRLVIEGKVYGGGSAGAIVAGPTINYFQSADGPQEAPEVILEGLNLTDIVPVPHWGNAKYGHIMESVNENLIKDGRNTVTITDEQALIINGSDYRVI